MSKILIVDDNESMLQLFRTRLSDQYEVIDTAHAREAVALALEHKPDAILLDLMMPEFSGFELCNNLHSLSYTSAIPIFIVSGHGAGQYREHCEKLGARGYFEKPVDFSAIKSALEEELQRKKPERRKHPRVRMRLELKLRGNDTNDQPFEEGTATDDVSADGFLCGCKASLVKGSTVEVFLAGSLPRYAGLAQAVRVESPGAPWQRYGFEFVTQTAQWIFQP